jgi:hypothetical protein
MPNYWNLYHAWLLRQKSQTAHSQKNGSVRGERAARNSSPTLYTAAVRCYEFNSCLSNGILGHPTFLDSG